MTRSTMNDLAAGAETPALRHQAFFYAGLDELVERTVAFVDATTGERCPVLIAVPQPHLDPVRAAVSDDGAPVRFVDMAEAGRNPGRILSGVFMAFAAEHRGHRVAVLDEPIWPGRSSAEYAEAVQHEALTNLALAGVPATILCAYDTTSLPPVAVADAARTHPDITGTDGSRPSSSFADPVDVAKSFADKLPPRPAHATATGFGPADLRSMRNLVGSEARAAGLEERRVDDLEYAVNEVLTNTVIHTGRPGLVSCWQDKSTFVCEVRDSGHIKDPLAGRRLPGTDQPTGRGLLLVHHLCDLVQVSTSRAGTTVRLHMNATNGAAG